MFETKYQKMLKGKRDLVNMLSNILKKYKDQPFLQSEKGFFKLIRKHSICLVNQDSFNHTLRIKCKELLRPYTLHFISPVVHKHFYRDDELMGLVRKVRNYNRHIKLRRKMIKAQLIHTTLCEDEISVVLSYV